MPYLADDAAPEPDPSTGPNSEPNTGVDQTTNGVVVIDDGVVRKRIRRPLDLVRFAVAVAVAAGTIALGWFATSTTAGLDSDLESGVSLIPSIVVLMLNIVGGIGTLGLPVAGAINLIIRKESGNFLTPSWPCSSPSHSFFLLPM